MMAAKIIEKKHINILDGVDLKKCKPNQPVIEINEAFNNDYGSDVQKLILNYKNARQYLLKSKNLKSFIEKPQNDPDAQTITQDLEQRQAETTLNNFKQSAQTYVDFNKDICKVFVPQQIKKGNLAKEIASKESRDFQKQRETFETMEHHEMKYNLEYRLEHEGVDREHVKDRLRETLLVKKRESKDRDKRSKIIGAYI